MSNIDTINHLPGFQWHLGYQSPPVRTERTTRGEEQVGTYISGYFAESELAADRTDEKVRMFKIVFFLGHRLCVMQLFRLGAQEFIRYNSLALHSPLTPSTKLPGLLAFPLRPLPPKPLPQRYISRQCLTLRMGPGLVTRTPHSFSPMSTLARKTALRES